MKKSVVIVSWNGENDGGGVERITYYMHQAWKDNYDVTIIDLAMVKCNRIYKRLLGIHYAIDAWLVSFYTNNYVKKMRKLKGNKNVILITQGFNAPGVKADISFAHGTMRGYRRAVSNDKRWHFNQLYEKMAWNKAKKVIAVGNHVKEEAYKYYKVNPDKIEIIENCVDTDSFYPMEKPLRDDLCTIVFCGRLEYGKGLDKLQELAEKIEQNDQYELLVATFEDEQKLFEKFEKTQVYTHFRQYDMNGFYNKGDIMFFPSLYEGFELATLESLSAGVPVVGNDVGAIGDFLKAKRSGIGMLSGNMDQDLILMFDLASEYKEMTKREQLHRDIEQSFSYSRYLEKLNLIIEDV